MKKENYTNFGGKKILFPAIVKISFAPLFESLRNLSRDDDNNVANFAITLLEELKQYPELEEGFSDHNLLTKYEIPISKLLRILFPDSLQTNEIKGVTAPFDFRPFFTSTRFRNILKAAGDNYDISVMDLTDDEIYIFVCCVILGKFYHYPVDLATPFKLSIPDQVNNITRIYRVAFNADMISVSPAPAAPPITKDDYALLIERFDDIALWKEKFPPDSYVLSGIGIVNLMDMTTDHSIAGITTNVLAKSHDSLSEISAHLRKIFRKPDLMVGYIKYENDSLVSSPDKKASGIFLDQLPNDSCNNLFGSDDYEQLIENRQPVVITDTEKHGSPFKSPLAEVLRKRSIGSYIIIPLVFENDLLGFIELASENKYELSLASLNKLTDILPIISMALSHFKTEGKNEMDAVIQQEFTKIHPSVKWRFEEEARKYIKAKRSNEEVDLIDLDFDNVYPLFGQLDIKGSSTIRNEVIQKDISAQLVAIKNILARAYHKKNLPLYEELIFRTDKQLREINKGLQAGSEHEILYFLTKDIVPVFEHLKKADKTIAVAVKKYEEQLDPHSKLIYHERKKFDESIGVINSMLSEHLDMRQEEAQQMFPHYFERYKTDGIEFNIYVGASVAKGYVFDKIYVQNLRLWQLIVMAELENEFFKLKKDLQEPLEIASLIMAQSDPLTIHFRLDEKRFDVKGAYNARYEIIKSRIDKALLKGSDERVTVPGRLAIIYTNDLDAAEYIRYIDFLTTKGYFKKGSLEELVLEDLQGITGLKALRVGINYILQETGKGKLPVMPLIEAMAKN